MTLTSTAFANGGAFPPANTCAGVNTSPPLTWTAGPTGVTSYAVDLTDMTNGAVHWVIWDIPANTTSLPAALPGDATLTTPVMGKQLHRAAFFGAGSDYRGPCPNGAVHNYRFQVNAIPTATLAGVAGMTTDQIKVLIQGVSLAHGDLNGTSDARMAPADAGGQ
jgi:Raf kinase inhibitor-like YbhB/YbcL family protein